MAAIVVLLATALSACGRQVDVSLEVSTPDSPVTRLSKLGTRTPVTASSATPTRSTVPVPDPASHVACRLLDWADLPADVRPTDPSPHVTYTDRPDECRIDNSLFGVAVPEPGTTTPPGEPDIQFFMARAIVSDELSPIEQFLEPENGCTGSMITVNGQRAVESVCDDDPPNCTIVVEPAAGPFLIMIQNSRFPQHTPCELARPLAETILQRHY